MKVMQDSSRRTLIIVRQGTKFISGVELSDGELTVSKFTDEDLQQRGFKDIDYPLDRAVDHFLRHNGGLSDAARRALLELRN
ncbi:hypothetical protein EBZ80_26160 [bacterium]|nr:hypothetical protein [bacterium]